VFNGVLEFPEKIIIQDRKKWDFWGECEGWQRGHRYGPHYTKAIRLQKTYLDPKRFIDVMAHEMVHQYEWERQGVMTHGKTFWAWKEKLAEKGIPLTSSFA
jgi:predicted SprT family Zn-dependent metalloprotease